MAPQRDETFKQKGNYCVHNIQYCRSSPTSTQVGRGVFKIFAMKHTGPVFFGPPCIFTRDLKQIIIIFIYLLLVVVKLVSRFLLWWCYIAVEVRRSSCLVLMFIYLLAIVICYVFVTLKIVFPIKSIYAYSHCISVRKTR